MHKRNYKTVILWSILGLAPQQLSSSLTQSLIKIFHRFGDSYIHGPISLKVCSNVGVILKCVSDNWHRGKSKIILQKVFFLILIDFTPYLRFVCTSLWAFRLRLWAMTSGNVLHLARSLHSHVSNTRTTVLLFPVAVVGIREASMKGPAHWLPCNQDLKMKLF